MASRFDLASRIAALQAHGLTVASEYRGKPAKWLVSALKACDAYVINCKGIRVDDTIVMVRLAKLEQLLVDADPQPNSQLVVELTHSQSRT